MENNAMNDELVVGEHADNLSHARFVTGLCGHNAVSAANTRQHAGTVYIDFALSVPAQCLEKGLFLVWFHADLFRS